MYQPTLPNPTSTLLLVDDNEVFCQVMARALVRRGFEVHTAHNTSSAISLAKSILPDYGVIDLKMPGDSGLTLLKHLKIIVPFSRILMLTGYASIPTAIEAIKLGATYYLAKPVDADEIMAAFRKSAGDDSVGIRNTPLSVEQLEWEHIQKVLTTHRGNISATARALNMHRRTLQRKLAKHAPKEST